MFKLFEKDKCVTLQLDMTTVATLPAHAVDKIVPGVILYDGNSGALDAVDTTVNGAYSITEATAGRFYIAMDYYNNTLNHSYAASAEPGSGQYTKGHGKISAIPVLENFTAVIQVAATLAKGDPLTIVEGVWVKATSTKYVCAMVTEANGTYSDTPLDTKITTWCARYTM